MSKRKEKSDSDIQDESPPTKLLKSDVIAGRRSKKHGMKKSKSSDHSDGSSASSGGRNDVTTVSSNWIALSKVYSSWVMKLMSLQVFRSSVLCIHI